MGSHDAGERIAIDDGLGEQLLAGRRPAQEAEVRGDLQLGIAGTGVYPNTPCRNQRCEPVAVFSPSPDR
jgi:hypothetical protein